MIKKLLFSMIAVLGISSMAAAKDVYAHDASVLPKAAQTTLANSLLDTIIKTATTKIISLLNRNDSRGMLLY